MPEIQTIILEPPQKCGVLKDGQICGNPARYATAEAAPLHCSGHTGYLLVLPICEACARPIDGQGEIVSSGDDDLVLVTHSIRLPTVPAPGVLRAAAQLLDDQAARMTRDAGVLRERAGEIAIRN